MDLYRTFYKLIVANLNKSNIYEYSTHYLLNTHINSCSNIIDLGANKGAFYSLLNCRYNCTCYVVEASPYLFKELPRNSKIKAFNYAVGKENGSVTFFLSNNSEANSLEPLISNIWGTFGSLMVEGITFEKFIKQESIKNIDVLKIDIEGAEIDVLEEISSGTFLSIKQITIEFHDFLYMNVEYKRRMNKVIRKLKNNNFLIIKISDANWREVLFLNKRLLHLSLKQKIRFRLIIPFLLTCMSFYRKASSLKNFVFKKEILLCI